MSRLKRRDESSLEEQSLTALEPFRMGGKLADVYLEFAASEPALRAYLAMEMALQAGSLCDEEIEAIKLTVSQHTGCDYCLSVHTVKAKKVGLDAERQRLIRMGMPTGNPRLDVILGIVRALIESPGILSDGMLAAARHAQISDETLVDMTMATSTILFTNITNHINDTRSPLPSAPSLVAEFGPETEQET